VLQGREGEKTIALANSLKQNLLYKMEQVEGNAEDLFHEFISMLEVCISPLEAMIIILSNRKEKLLKLCGN